MTRSLFITGMQRSGTTLLDKLLAAHPRISMLSQPFPALFVAVKRLFLERLDAAADAYPLGDLFLEERYDPDDFSRFAAGFEIDDEALVRAFEAMEDYSGQYTRVSRDALAGLLPDLTRSGFPATVAHLYRALAHRPAPLWCGGKETSCEEFLPALLDAGFLAVVVVRDPREVLLSLNHGSGRAHAGRLKPTLFNVRQWRKSVAFTLGLACHPRFVALRYEDLLNQPESTLEALAARLEVEPFPERLARETLFDQQGRPWSGNSSFGPRVGLVPPEPLDRDLLPPGVALFVEAACWPELRALGYDTSLQLSELPAVLAGFRDPYALERDELARYRDPERIAEEVERLRRLRHAPKAGDRAYFLFERAQARLALAAVER